jgi:hypothetical protein
MSQVSVRLPRLPITASVYAVVGVPRSYPTTSPVRTPDSRVTKIACSIAAASSKGPSEAALELVDLANERGGNDNITVLIARIAGMGKPQRKTLFGKFRRR